MAANKEKVFSEKAQAFFADKKNDNINKVYITSDGWVFRAEHYAKNWIKENPKLTLETHFRAGSRPVDDLIAKIVAEKFGSNTGEDLDQDDQTQAPSDREGLVKEYIELFDTKPHHMFSDDKIKLLIAEKKAELAKEGDPDQEENTDADQDSKEPENVEKDAGQSESE
ncbi:hypothetical protein [Sphingobacterium sp. UBA5980]|uniref:hypothetical protein n=1 Tax=Sphingobacterium sp. UBA5980 TaxID=1947504 RepID=UPI00257C4454|nr:hypothetical protein [Sphingobacterium sp. UBA5980]